MAMLNLVMVLTDKISASHQDDPDKECTDAFLCDKVVEARKLLVVERKTQVRKEGAEKRSVKVPDQCNVVERIEKNADSQEQQRQDAHEP